MIPLVLFLVSLVAAYSSRQPCHNNGLVSVQTVNGRVDGFVDAKAPQVRQFLGIPYAKPPLGDLRFAPPEPVGHFGTLDARSLPLSCPQTFSNKTATIYSRYILEYNLQGLNYTAPTSEDCLKLSAWTPNKKAPPGGWPVIIYVYGGGFGGGGMDVPYQIPTQWVQRTYDHIVVTFNYRVNIFGFPSSEALPAHERNVGLLDQRLAVEWVAANIKAFGGDPERMILWGQSAGAASVSVYSYSYPENPLVRGLVHDSGSEGIFPFPYPEQVTSNFTFVAGKMGCGDLTHAEELSCMRKIPAESIESFLLEYGESGAGPGLNFWPVVDERLLFSNWTDRAVKGQIARIPAITGTNKDEGAYQPYDPNDPAQVIAFNATIQAAFLCPSVRSTKIRARVGLHTYRYRYAGNFTNISPVYWLGAYHTAEVPMLMGTHPNYRGNSTEEEYALSAFMQDAWVAFARDGVDGLEGVGWPRYDNSTGEGLIMQFGNGDIAHTETADWLEQRCWMFDA